MTRAAIGLLLLAAATRASAQDTTIYIRPGRPSAAERVVARQLPPDVADEVIRIVNAETTLRFSGATRIPAARGVDGDVAILGGPVVVGGRIGGALVVVNGDVQFETGAVVSGDVLVVGGALTGADRASVAGAVRVYRDPLRYRMLGDRMVSATASFLEPPRWIRQHDWEAGRESETGFLLALGGTYNRVEGLPILLGPRADLRLSERSRLLADATAIFRTEDISLDAGDLGYRARAELVLGGRYANVGLGVRGFDEVKPIEAWPLKDFEVGWASFLLHRDYRDYFRQRGGAIYATWRFTSQASVTAEWRGAFETSLGARTPWTLFRTSDPWRANPPITDGRYRSLVGSFHFDTRNDQSMPSAGALVVGEYEFGQGRDITGALGPYYCGATSCTFPVVPNLRVDYQRLGFDARTYLRLSPTGRLDLRLAGGGWTGGDPLPLQRRLSLGYPDPLPGYGFRQFSCNGGLLPGAPALCDRALLAQAEFRTHLGLDFGPDWVSDWGTGDEHYEPFHVSGPDLVLFADAGRAWLVSRAGETGPDILPPDRVPALDSYRTDIGLGLDFGPLGFYVAKPLEQAEHSLTFTVRMGRRF